jgi:endonuclease YncB( thermonuclease family)
MSIRSPQSGLSRIAIVLALTLAATLSGCLSQDSFEGRCVKVYDGDTIEVMAGGSTSLRVRLHAIDAPEKGQPFSNVARTRTRELVEGKRVRVEVRDRDQYDRLVARIYVEDADLSEQLIREGLAWHYTRYSSEIALGNAQREARRAHRGLWQDPEPEPPWAFRRRQREARAP